LSEIRAGEVERSRLLKISHDAQTANRAKDRFLAMLSHELRTPLTPILAAVTSPDLIDAIPPRLRYLLDIARQSVEMEVRLIDDLLDVSRITEAKVRLDKVQADLHEVVRDVVRMCAVELREKELQLVVEFQAQRHRALADPARMRQVFLNLLRNAIKFTPPGNSIFIRSANL